LVGEGIFAQMKTWNIEELEPDWNLSLLSYLEQGLEFRTFTIMNLELTGKSNTFDKVNDVTANII